jgi:hypothetical protein
MTLVGAGHEQRQTTTGADPGGGKFDSGVVFILGAGATTGVAGDSPGMVYGGMSLRGACIRMETRSAECWRWHSGLETGVLVAACRANE